MPRLNREHLLQQLEAVQPGLSTREIIEQSSCIIFRDGEAMTYNDEIACRCKTDLDITAAVRAEPLLAVLRKLQEDEVVIEAGEGELLVQGKGRKSGIQMEQNITLPIDVVEVPTKWRPLPSDFNDAILLVQQCAGKDESAFKLTCVHVHPDYVEACDNYQLSRYTLRTGAKKPYLVRGSAIKHITSLGMVETSETTAWVHFRNPVGLVLSCRRYLEDFPSLDAMLSMKGTPTTLPKGLIEAADIAQIFSAENADQNQVMIDMRPGKVRLKGQGASGWYSEVKKLAYDGEPISFLISPVLLMELINRHNDCEITSETLRVKTGKFVYVSCLGTPETTTKEAE